MSVFNTRINMQSIAILKNNKRGEKNTTKMKLPSKCTFSKIFLQVHPVLWLGLAGEKSSSFFKSLNQKVRVIGTYMYFPITRSAGVPYYSEHEDPLNTVSNKRQHH